MPDPTLAVVTVLLVYLCDHRVASGKTRDDPASLIVAADALATAVDAVKPKTAAPTQIILLRRKIGSFRTQKYG